MLYLSEKYLQMIDAKFYQKNYDHMKCYIYQKNITNDRCKIL